MEEFAARSTVEVCTHEQFGKGRWGISLLLYIIYEKNISENLAVRVTPKGEWEIWNINNSIVCFVKMCCGMLLRNVAPERYSGMRI